MTTQITEARKIHEAPAKTTIPILTQDPIIQSAMSVMEKTALIVAIVGFLLEWTMMIYAGCTLERVNFPAAAVLAVLGFVLGIAGIGLMGLMYLLHDSIFGKIAEVDATRLLGENPRHYTMDELRKKLPCEVFEAYESWAVRKGQ